MLVAEARESLVVDHLGLATRVLNGEKLSEFFHCQPGPTPVNHPMTVGADQREVCELRSYAGGQLGDRDPVVALYEAST